MDHLIATYLFIKKQCPLPGLGKLVIENKVAENDFVNKTIAAPQPVIRFDAADLAPGGLVNFIAAQQAISIDLAAIHLEKYCETIKAQISSNTSYSIPAVGNFFIAPEGTIVFEGYALPNAYLPDIPAERVVHPQAEHNILVGDKESTNTAMADFFNEEIPEKKSRWWIWAIILLCIGTIMLLNYFFGNNNTGSFGNCVNIF